MRRTMLLVTVALVMAAMMVVMAAPAFARANIDHASCPGNLASSANELSPGAGGSDISTAARSGSRGVSDIAPRNCN
jgi:hypothetical protein